MEKEEEEKREEGRDVVEVHDCSSLGERYVG